MSLLCLILKFINFQHLTTINQISIDDNGDYMASCSDDGKVGRYFCEAFFVNEICFLSVAVWPNHHEVVAL